MNNIIWTSAARERNGEKWKNMKTNKKLKDLSHLSISFVILRIKQNTIAFNAINNNNSNDSSIFRVAI